MEKNANEYWKKRFGEEPKSDNDKLMCAMMMEFAEYYQQTKIEELQKEVEQLDEFSNYKIHSVNELTKQLNKELEENTKLREQLKQRDELQIGQNLFEQLKETCGFTALEDDMRQIIHAIQRDNQNK